MSGFKNFLLDRGRSQRYQLALAMAGVRMGERLLTVGDDAALVARLAARLGLTGRCVVAVPSEDAAARVTAAAAEAGVLLEDILVAPPPALPVDQGAFDVVVISGGPALLAGLDASGRASLAIAIGRALRPGGRAIVVEGQPKNPLNPFPVPPVGPGAFGSAGGAISFLKAAGFHPVRLLADRDGQRFTEGMKRAEAEAGSRRPGFV